eukprot:scaffold29618_cov45-Cyclotella_meneghiniana.AAC.2
MHRLARTIPTYYILLLVVISLCLSYNIAISIVAAEQPDDNNDELIDLDLENDFFADNNDGQDEDTSNNIVIGASATISLIENDITLTTDGDEESVAGGDIHGRVESSDGGASITTITTTTAAASLAGNTEDGEFKELDQVMDTIQDLLQRLEDIENDGTTNTIGNDAELRQLIQSINTFVGADGNIDIDDILPGGSEVWQGILQEYDAVFHDEDDLVDDDTDDTDDFDGIDDYFDDVYVDPEATDEQLHNEDFSTNNLEQEIQQILQSIDAINEDDGNNIDNAELQQIIQRIQAFVDADVIDDIMPGGRETWEGILQQMSGLSDDVGGGVEVEHVITEHMQEIRGGENIIDRRSDENQYYDPMGLQTWSNEKDFVQALAGGRLVLVIIFAPWCDESPNVLSLASKAAHLLDDLFTSDDFNSLLNDLNLAPSVPLLKPLIGIIDSESAPPILIESLGRVTSYPSIKCVLTYPDSADDDIVMWDYIGQRESADDLYESAIINKFLRVIIVVQGIQSSPLAR